MVIMILKVINSLVLRVNRTRNGLNFFPLLLVAFVIGVQTVAPPIVVINVVTWFVFWFDKQQSKLHNWRTPERELLWWLWTTGVFGGWLSMFVCRHKIRKQSFITKALLFTVFNLTWFLLYLILDLPKKIFNKYHINIK
ncbi:hypothetical protein RhiirA1_151714 [Rhizophagus irregularis]|uniref:DUF1294 domain-containing protein n=3 Tax=Rhizophagus irregularis TaxID=588596 RepID=A0A2N0RXX5_9GLOM|nr:hypothetical protein RirG_191930 [Rhizophagus irregularis DAOM 197198w]PKC68136.1 hypothetical protein RhiirA1_151714 [Rhizophagus irregularis]